MAKHRNQQQEGDLNSDEGDDLENVLELQDRDDARGARIETRSFWGGKSLYGPVDTGLQHVHQRKWTLNQKLVLGFIILAPLAALIFFAVKDFSKDTIVLYILFFIIWLSVVLIIYDMTREASHVYNPQTDELEDPEIVDEPQLPKKKEKRKPWSFEGWWNGE